MRGEGAAVHRSQVSDEWAEARGTTQQDPRIMIGLERGCFVLTSTLGGMRGRHIYGAETATFTWRFFFHKEPPVPLCQCPPGDTLYLVCSLDASDLLLPLLWAQ